MNSNSNIILAIVGSRNFNNVDKFNLAIIDFINKYGMPSCIVSGGATGADTLGENWHRTNLSGEPIIFK